MWWHRTIMEGQMSTDGIITCDNGKAYDRQYAIFCTCRCHKWKALSLPFKRLSRNTKWLKETGWKSDNSIREKISVIGKWRIIRDIVLISTQLCPISLDERLKTIGGPYMKFEIHILCEIWPAFCALYWYGKRQNTTTPSRTEAQSVSLLFQTQDPIISSHVL